MIFDKNKIKEIEYINKDENEDIGLLLSRIIEDQTFIENFKSVISAKECSN